MTCQSVKNVATFCDNHFFYEPGTVIVGNLYSVSSPEMADMMEKRDFVRFGPTHITEMNALPHLSTATSNAEKSPEDIARMAGMAAPMTLSLCLAHFLVFGGQRTVHLPRA
jgi:hypothetical protein